LSAHRAGEEVNAPRVVAEVTQAFERYERALTGNDVALLDALFWDSPHTIRYGATENLHGYDAIRAFRAARPAAGLARTLHDVVVTTFGEDFATVNAQFTRNGVARTGRQSQTWVRMPDGWKVVAAHVSLVDRSA
jgi:hypothetical protein